MRTVPAALLWELADRGRWWIPGSALGAIAFPLLLFGVLRRDGAFDPADPQMIVVQSVIMQIGMMMIGASMFTSVSKPSRLFSRPVSNSGIALAHLVPAGVMTAVVWTLSTLLLNAVLPLDWPLLGPALFAAVAIPAIMSACWLTEKSFWLLPALAGTGLFLGVWFKSRFGPVSGSATHLWRNVMAVDFLVLLAVAVSAYLVGVMAIARRRRNDVLTSFDLQSWLEKLLDRVFSRDMAFSSPDRAQLWAEHSRKGWILPGTFVVCSLVAFALWLIFSRDPRSLLEVVTAAGITVSFAAGLISAFVFNSGPTESNWSMGPFLGTRPMTSSVLARCTMLVQLRSVAMTTGLWLMAYLGAYSLADPMMRSSSPSVWVILVLAACPWLCASVGSTVALTGRAQYFAAAFMITLFSHYAFAGVVQLIASRDIRQELLNTAVLSTISILSAGTILGTIWAFVFAKRRGMIDRRSLLTAMVVAIGLGMLVLWGVLEKAPQTPLVYLVAAASVAVAVAPWATAPLAVAWNRSR